MTALLVVDDDPGMRITLRMILEAHGYPVMVANSGEEALQVAVEREPAAVVMDVKMPGMTGDQACRAIKARCPQLPVVMITAYAAADQKQQALESGAEGLLYKPLDLEELLGILAHTTGQRPGEGCASEAAAQGKSA